MADLQGTVLPLTVTIFILGLSFPVIGIFKEGFSASSQ